MASDMPAIMLFHKTSDHSHLIAVEQQIVSTEYIPEIPYSTIHRGLVCTKWLQKY